MATIDKDLAEIMDNCGTEFTPYHELDHDADALTVYFRGDRDYSKRLTAHVTLYLSLENNEIVGCRLKGITEILNDLPNAMRVWHGEVDLWLVFWAFHHSPEEVWSVMRQLMDAAAENDMRLTTSA